MSAIWSYEDKVIICLLEGITRVLPFCIKLFLEVFNGLQSLSLLHNSINIAKLSKKIL